MALANVGFLSAMAGKRVLLMDWDLEAPGLAYYFRGMTDHVESGGLRKASGVLNLFWDWANGIEAATTEKDVNEHIERFQRGEVFARCARPLISRRQLPKGAKLDFIGAGSPFIDAPEPTPYADALSRFNWTAFFEESAGGILIEELRSWCRATYDVILVDSRTGLADVAGICTMQLPDSVVLCFILNRQNIEGIAQVASAISSARGDDVQVRICPMRVSQDRPTEEADARARAQRQLERAGVSADRVEMDMDRLAIPVAANVPFYETLAPFAASDPAHDVLTLAYQGLTEALTGLELYRPKIDPAWRDEVRRRLEPKLSTVEYLESLQNAEPARAREEIERFVLGALDADPAMELDPDYVQALVTAALSIQDLDWDGDEQEAKTIAANAIELLRRLNAFGDGDWRLQLVNALEEYELNFEPRPAHVRHAEMQRILADGTQTFPILFRRLGLAVAQARALLRARPVDALDLMNEADELLDRMRSTDDRRDDLMALAEGEIADVRSAALMGIDPVASRREAEKALAAFAQAPIMSRALSQIAASHMRIARIEPNHPEAAQHVLQATQNWPRSTTSDVPSYVFAIETILAGPDPEADGLTFVTAAFGRAAGHASSRANRAVRSPIQMGQSTEEFTAFAKATQKLATVITENKTKASEAALGVLAEVAAQGLLRRMRRLSARRVARSGNATILKRYAHLYETLANCGAADRSLKLFAEALTTFDRWRLEIEE